MEIEAFIHGTPRTEKTGERTEGLKKWIAEVKSQTRTLGKISSACALEVDFVLSPGSTPPDRPHGPDLDNLLNGLFDGLEDTILGDAPGKDSAITKLTASKRVSLNDEPTGAWIRLRHIEVAPP